MQLIIHLYLRSIKFVAGPGKEAPDQSSLRNIKEPPSSLFVYCCPLRGEQDPKLPENRCIVNINILDLHAFGLSRKICPQNLSGIKYEMKRQAVLSLNGYNCERLIIRGATNGARNGRRRVDPFSEPGPRTRRRGSECVGSAATVVWKLVLCQ